MILGIGSYTFGWAVGVPGYPPPHPLHEIGLLEKAEQAGLKLLQIGDNLPLHTFTPARIAQLGARAAQADVELQVGARGLTISNVAAYSAICGQVRAKLLRFVIDEANYHPNPGEIITLLRECLPLLQSITLAIENHDRFPAATLREIIESVGDERIGICLDTANSLGAGEGLREVLPALAPFTVHLHIKDFTIERLPHLMGFTVSGSPAGSGKMDLPSILEYLSPFNRCHSAVLEQWTPPEATLEKTIAKEQSWASQSLHYLKSFFP